MKICDNFWPYIHSGAAVLPTEQLKFPRGVSQLLRERACVKSHSSQADDDYANALYAQGVSLVQVERAVHLACFRKYSSLISHGTEDLIVSFLYFRDVIDEVSNPQQPIHGETNEAYWMNVRVRMLQLERQWTSQNRSSHGHDGLSAIDR